MTSRTITAAALSAVALLPGGAALASDAPGQPARQTLAAPGPPTGDAAGIALARLANAHYAKRPVMGIEMRVPAPPGVIVVRGILRRGLTDAAVITVASGSDRATFIESPRGNFERLSGKRCWRRSSEPPTPRQPMIVVRGSRFFAPQPIGSLVRLEVNERDPASGERSRIAYKIDPATGRIATLIAGGVVANVRTLPAPPKIPAPKPLCPKGD